MSLTQSIYNFLTQSKNEAADQTLLAGLNLAEEPYRTKIFETIVQRGQSIPIAHLLHDYHQMSEAWQNILVSHIDKISAGVARAADSVQSQTRRNALTLLWKTRHAPLAETAAKLLNDKDPQVARMAANTLLLLTRHCFKMDRYTITDNDTAILTGKVIRNKLTGRQYLLRALKTAIHSWPRHQFDQIIKAVLFAVPVSHKSFWDNTFRPTNRLGLSIRDKIQNSDHKDNALVVLDALSDPFLRPAALRALTQSSNLPFIVSVAAAADQYLTAEAEHALKKIRDVRWINSAVVNLGNLNPHDQTQIIKLVERLSLPADKVEAWLTPAFSQVTEPVACRMLETLARSSSQIPLKALEYCLQSSHQRLAVMAIKHLLQNRPPHYRSLVVQSLNSPHAAVREIAAGFYRKVAFEFYWNQFDQLRPEQRKKAGQAVFKLDPQAHDRWREKTTSIRPEIRLRSIQLARILNLVSQHEDKICQLTTDSNARIRSSAIAALGSINHPLTRTAEHCLSTALSDMDQRVRANAVEIIGRKNLRQFQNAISPLVNDANNRVRANAIQILLKWKSQHVSTALKSMLTDSRPAHQRSARWLLNKRLNTTRPPAQSPAKPVQPVRFPSYSLSDLLNGATPRQPEPEHVH